MERAAELDASSPAQTAPTLKREVGLFSAIAVLIGMTIGSGIFTTPSIVFKNAGSAGIALFIWCLAGFKALIEVLCYAELATLLPAAGGSYAYITAGSRSLGRYGDIIPFMYAWSCMIISDPMSAAYQGLTFASYALSVVYGDCVPAYTTKLITALTFIALGTALNCISVKTSARVQDVLATFKCAALVSIIVSGAVSAFRVNKLLDAPLFSGVTTASNIVRAIFAAATSYGGWYIIIVFFLFTSVH
ncbi:Y+L amino acid transporter 2 [Ixodes scapularis]